jgi:rhodanese-related sulfurtransferase
MESAEPAAVHEISAVDLKAMIDRGEAFELIDVRTPAERAIAVIEGSRLLDQAAYEALLGLDPETPLVFVCHHGNRSRAAAHHFRQKGFGKLYNVRDGIEGWSATVDPSVRRY